MSKELTKEEIDKAFLNTNFGTQTNHEVLMEGLYKIIIGYENGRTCTCVLLELGLIRTVDRNMFCLTDEGLKYYNRGESEKKAVAFAEWKHATKDDSCFYYSMIGVEQRFETISDLYQYFITNVYKP